MRFLIYILICGVLLLFYELNSQSISVSVDIQMSLFGKILTFDKNLESKANKNKIVNIGILYQSKNRNSLNLRNEVLKNLSEKDLEKVLGVKSKINPIDIDDINSLENYLKINSIDVIILTYLRAVSIESIAETCQKNKIMSFSLLPEYIDNGISVAIDIKGEKPLIVVNLSSAQKEGVNFSSHLLKLSKIIK